MRILHFTRSYTVHDKRFLDALAGTAHEVFLLCLHRGGSLMGEFPPAAAINTSIPALSQEPVTEPEDCLPLMPLFDKIVGDLKPDLIQAGPLQSCGFMAALSGKSPLLAMSWGYDILYDAARDEKMRWIAGWTLKRAGHLLCDCLTVKKEACEISGIPSEDVTQFPWGIDLESFSPGKAKLREKLGWEDSFVILTMRSWEELYGTETVLEAFRLAQKQEPRLRLLMPGDGSQREMLRAFLSKNKIDEFVYCPGLVPNETLPEYFRTADAYLSCSHCDGSSISLLEALASGLPALVSELPGNREWITPAVNGFLAKAGDAGDFASGLMLLSQLPKEERNEIALRNRRMVEERADWKRNFPKLLDSYGKCIAKKRAK
ncbi:MAG: hypothetical protein A2X49_05450 [Lentisphaerae bacterium GWF2_52_8]|nr:MAG: hypothetical protein A2X49_05450 [Lentisphaerae bacterium GWF2_52_8]